MKNNLTLKQKFFKTIIGKENRHIIKIENITESSFILYELVTSSSGFPILYKHTISLERNSIITLLSDISITPDNFEIKESPFCIYHPYEIYFYKDVFYFNSGYYTYSFTFDSKKRFFTTTNLETYIKIFTED